MGAREVLVVGGGLSGLAAAIGAASRGHAVTVLEAAAAPGGRARSTDVRGHRFNLGPHAWFTTGAAAATARAMGVTVDGVVPTPTPYLLDTTHAVPISLGGWWRGEVGLGSLVGAAAGLAGLAGGGDDRSVAAWVEGREPETSALLLAISRVTTYVNDPAALSVATVAHQLGAARGGVRYVHGGWQALVDALVARATALGVRIEARHPVVRAEGGPQPRVIGRDGAARSADRVVVTGPIDRVAALLPDSRVADHAEGARPARMASIDLGLERLPDPDCRFALGTDRPIYASVHSVAAGLAPGDAVTLHAAWYRAPGDHVDRTGEIEAALDVLQPGWRDVVTARRDLDAVVACSDPPTIGRTRLGIDVGLEGVRVAGDWVGPHHLADAALSSGYEAGSEA